jgi:hypothetical protein
MCHSSILRVVMWVRRGRDCKRWVRAVWKVGRDFGLERRMDVSLDRDSFEEDGSSLVMKWRRQTVNLVVLVITNGSL